MSYLPFRSGIKKISVDDFGSFGLYHNRKISVIPIVVLGVFKSLSSNKSKVVYLSQMSTCSMDIFSYFCAGVAACGALFAST